jgi:hypothetical protein
MIGELEDPPADSSCGVSMVGQREDKNLRQDANVSGDKLGLEDIVHLANKIGLEYANAKREAERLELIKPSVRAKIAIRLDSGDLSEVKLKRLTETDPEYLEFLEKLVNARGESERLRIRYESYKNLFEAKRSLLSYQKAEMKLL